MKIKFKNLGPLRQAEFELGDFTIICGCNNTGKTYATYALFGFLDFWHNSSFGILDIHTSNIDRLIENASIQIDLDDYVKKASNILKDASKLFSKRLPEFFASNEKHFLETEFSINIDSSNIKIQTDKYERTLGSPKEKILQIIKNEDENILNVSLLGGKNQVRFHPEFLQRIIGDSIKDVVFGSHLPRPFIASAERTGAAIFRKELDFTRNRLIEQMGLSKGKLKQAKLLELIFDEGISGYALPVRRNVDFMGDIEALSKKDSFIVKNHKDILSDFSDIIDGEYRVVRTRRPVAGIFVL